MEKNKMLNRIKELYKNGGNIIQYLKSLNENQAVSTEDILISYDFQAGVYTQRADINREVREQYCQNLANEIDDLGSCESILEVGVGEASTIGNLLTRLKSVPKRIFGFDLSWSRIMYANKFMDAVSLPESSEVLFCTGDLFNPPFADSAIDIVYTSHTLEPNGGMEKEALESLYRITNKYLIMLEPAYELAHEEAKTRMEKYGYVTKLYQTAIDLGYDIVKYDLFKPTFKDINPTGIMIIKKGSIGPSKAALACPITKTELVELKGALYSENALLAYPILDNIPCLLPSNAIVASHFMG